MRHEIEWNCLQARNPELWRDFLIYINSVEKSEFLSKMVQKLQNLLCSDHTLNCSYVHDVIRSAHQAFIKMIQIYFQCIWCVLEHSMLTFVLSLDHHGHPLKYKLWSLFYTWGNWDSERLNNLSKIMQVLNDRAGTWT